jgi:pyroglutamyl-peptidase
VSARAPLTVLLTGFGPFPGAAINPTAALVRRLARNRRPTTTEVRRIAHVFATRYDAVDRELADLLARHKPVAVIMFGLAARRKHVYIETRARNRRSMSFPDAGGDAPARAVIDDGAGAQLRGRAPMRRLLSAARAADLDVRLSRDAGRYVCNYVYWRALAAAEQRGGPRVAVFVHVPALRRPHARRNAGRRRLAAADLMRVGEAVIMAAIAAARAPA